MGQIIESLIIAIQAVFASKTRAFLTMLGIIIGILSVSLMGAAISGIDNVFENSMANLGNDVLYLEKYSWFMGEDEWWEVRNRPDIQSEYADKIQERSRFVAFASPRVNRFADITYGDNALENISIEGTSWKDAFISSRKMSDGRFFSQIEDHGGSKVVIIGSNVANNLFPNQKALSEKIKINGVRFNVIGILEAQGKFLGLFNQDDLAIIPYTAARSLFGRRGYLSINLKLQDGSDIEAAKEDVRLIVRSLRGLKPSNKDNFAINQQEAFKQQLDGIKMAIGSVGIGITALSLIVGGIGIMNIMFVSVKERTREIGIRKALGAKRGIILFQFLGEAVIISLIGGIIGVLLTTALVGLVQKFFVASLSPSLIIISISVSIVTGILSGIVPANQAARLDPIEAIRYE